MATAVPLIQRRRSLMRQWTYAMYGHRRTVIVWGWFFWVYLIAVTVKVVVYWVVAALIGVLWILCAAADLVTYHWRKTGGV